MTLTVLNPATGEPIAELEQAGVEEADEAVARALRVARAVDAGVLSVNANTSVRVQTPFGGFKQSGFGRELGMHALDGYSEVKSVFVSTEG
jgi:acyl-CoA reductase-like NAD-dependent aldehyde dehydrogenase